MHASYLFAINVDAAPADADEKAIGERAVSYFERHYAHHRCDENNWWQAEGLVLPDNRVINVCPAGDWRGRDGWAAMFNAEYPQLPRFEAAKLFAASCVAIDMEVWSIPTIGLIPHDAKAQAATRHIEQLFTTGKLKATLVRLGKARLAKLSKQRGKGKHGLGPWRTKKLGGMLYYLQSCDIFPFTTGGPPDPYENYRAIDLREDTAPAPWGILSVDIHT